MSKKIRIFANEIKTHTNMKETLKDQVKREFAEYIKDYGTAPKYAEVKVLFKNEDVMGAAFTTNVKLDGTTTDTNDDEIEFYYEDLNALLETIADIDVPFGEYLSAGHFSPKEKEFQVGGEDFTIVEFHGFFNLPSVG